nr:hypothetical protein [uncultured bacterium]
MFTPDPDFPQEQYFASRAWLAVVLLGVLVTAVGLPLMGVFPASAYTVQPGFGAPIFALEMARTIADVDAVLGPIGDTLRAERIQQMDSGNRFDFIFLTAYALFMASFFYAVLRATGNKLWVLPVVIGLASGVCDAVENFLLLTITSGQGAEQALIFLPFAAWGKFFAIFICLVLAARYIQKSRSKVLNFSGWLALVGALSIPAAFYDPSRFGWLVEQGVTVSWVAMLLYALVRAWRSHALLKQRAR